MSNNACNKLKMKLNIRQFGQIIFTLLLIICYQYNACSQETDSGNRNKPGLFFGISVGTIKNKNCKFRICI